MKYYIKGKKINLRRLIKSDAQSLFENARDKEISRYTTVPHPYTLQHAYDFIKMTHRKQRKNEALNLGIELRETKKIIGMISLTKIQKINCNAELGYWLGKKFWGQNIIQEAVKMMLNVGFNQLKLHKINACVIEPNIKSQKVLLRAGFVSEGISRENMWTDNKWCDYLRFGLLKKEYKLKKD